MTSNWEIQFPLLILVCCILYVDDVGADGCFLRNIVLINKIPDIQNYRNLKQYQGCEFSYK